MEQRTKELLNLLIKLDKAYTECSWDYERNCEYKHLDYAKKCSKLMSAIDKKQTSIWDEISKQYNVSHMFKLPSEILDYYSDGCNNNNYDRFNNYERDLKFLGIQI
jgi:hypothetical protein